MPTADSKLAEGSRVVFEAAGRRRTWAEALAAAYLRGDAQPLEQEVRDAASARQYAEEQGFSLAVGEDTAEEFRQAHNLITGEELEAWLAHVGLGLEQFEAYFAGGVLRRRFASELPLLRRDYPAREEDVLDAMWCAAHLSERFEPFTRALAERVALRASGVPRAQASAALGPLPEALRAWQRELSELEALYQRELTVVLAPERVERAIQEREASLARIVVVEMTFASREAADEAYLCLTVDGSPPEEVAERASIEPSEHMWFPDQAPEELASLFWAPAGRALSPRQSDEGWTVRVLRERVGPSAADPEVAARARQLLLSSRFDPLVSTHVRWSFEPWAIG